MKVTAVLTMAVLLLAGCVVPTPTPTPTATPTSSLTLHPTAPLPTFTPTPRVSPTPTRPAVQMGTLEMRVTDQPVPDVTKVQVTAKEVQVHREGGPEEGGWKTVVSGPVSFDLLKVQGVEELLGTTQLEAGTYTQIRLKVEEVEVTLRGVNVKAEVPSDEIKIVRPISIEPGQTTIATLDFDAGHSVNVTGRDKVLFRPVVALLTRKGTEPFKPARTPGAAAIPTPTAAQTPPTVATFTPTTTVGAATEPFLKILSPEKNETVVSTPTFTIVGQTRADAMVSINDEFVEPDADGTFQKAINLEVGPNIIEVVASVATGQQLSEVLVVIYSP